MFLLCAASSVGDNRCGDEGGNRGPFEPGVINEESGTFENSDDVLATVVQMAAAGRSLKCSASPATGTEESAAATAVATTTLELLG